MEIPKIKAFNIKMESFIDKMLPELEEIYKDIHRSPELSVQEFLTSKMAADYLTRYQYEVSTGIGWTGVVGLISVKEATGLPYSGNKVARDEEGVDVGVSHVCGHDLHVTWLMGVARLFSEHKDEWKGSLLLVFQPGEEIGLGAQNMIDDGLMDRFPKPNIILGQHVMLGESGTVGYLFWFVGGMDPKTYQYAKKNNQVNSIPRNNSPKLAPVINPTLNTVLQAMTTTTLPWLD